MPGALPETHVTVAPGGRLIGTGPIAARYGLSDVSAPLAGPPIASSGALTLYLLTGQLALGSVVEGLYPNSYWSGRHVVYRRFRCEGGAVRVTLASDPALFRATKTVTVKSGPRILRLHVPPARPVETLVPLVPSAGTCRVDFTVRPSPAISNPPGTPPQPLGLQFFFS